MSSSLLEISVDAIAGSFLSSIVWLLVRGISITVGSSFLCSGLLLGLLICSSFSVLADLLLLLLLDDQVGTVAGTWLRLVDMLVDRDDRIFQFSSSSRVPGSLRLASDDIFSVRVGLQETNGLLSGGSTSKVTSSPVGEASVILGCSTLVRPGRSGVPLLDLLVDSLDFILGRGCLLVTHLLVVFLVVLVKLSRSVVATTATHLLAHHLGESTACLRHLESTLRLLGFFCLSLSLHSLDVGLPESASGVGLPLCKVEHIKCFGRVKQFLATATEYIDRVVNFDALIEDTGHDHFAIG